MKTSKRIISFVLCVLMVASCFFCTGKLPELEAKAASVGDFTQTRVVSDYATKYREYQKRFFRGEETNWPTDFVIPGLSGGNEWYTPQGMTYWEEQEWILISAYDASGQGRNSVIYALDVTTTDLVAVFKIQNADGTTNTSHGGGIAASKYNFYYADSDSKISYVPLSEMKVSKGTQKTIRLRGSINCASELGTAATSYCCYEDGVLWAGNFYLNNKNYNYGQAAHSSSNSMIVGYRLRGNSSEEEWNNLQRGNIIVPSSKYGTNLKGDTQAMTFSSTLDDRGYFDISGNVAASSAGEDYATFGTAYLEKDVTYKLEFDTDGNSLPFNFYFIKPGYTSINDISYINSANTQWKENVDSNGNFDGTYHVVHTFTPGQPTPGAYTQWHEQSDVSGTYEIRFDQDNVANAHSFSFQNVRIVKVIDGFNEGFTTDSNSGYDCEGNPSYVVTIPGVDKIQYAMVSKGKMYISRSWSRDGSGSTHTRELMIADIDLGSPGTTNLEINNRTRPCHVLSVGSTTRFGGDKNNSSHDLTKMLYMGEALCVIDDYLYMFGESAGYSYQNGDGNGSCAEPIDVIWKIDQYAIQGLTRPHEDVNAVEYEKVTSLSQINNKDEYIIVHQSPIKDSVSQDNILYVLDAFGGYGDKKLPKKSSASDVSASSTGNSIGLVGYEIRDYSVKTANGKTSLILDAADDANKSMHWQFESGNSTSLKLYNRDLYYAKHPYFYSGDTLFAMTSTAGSMTIADLGNGNFNISGNSGYKIWCNDGSVASSITAYTNHYANSNITAYTPNYHDATEVAGTFHTHNANNPATGTADQQIFNIYKRVTDPYASSYETQVYTDLQAKLTADGTYNITLETYATNNLQYQRVDERPTDFIFVVDVSGSMDQKDAQGYNTDYTGSEKWTALKMRQVCGDVGDSYFTRGDNYNKAHLSSMYYRLPDGEFGRIGVAFNEKGSSSKYERDIWLWVEHPVTKRCYRLSKLGFLTKGDFAGDANTNDKNNRLSEADYLANPEKYGWVNQADVMSDVNADINRTDYHGTDYDTTKKRGNYEVLNLKYTDDSGTQVLTYYTYGSCQRILAVSQAMDKLVLKIQNEANRSKLDHRVAIVTSGSDGTYVSDNRPWANTGILTNDGTWRNYTGGTSLDSYYASAFFNANNFTTVRNYVKKLPVYGHSPINQGLTLASNIINKQVASGTTYDVNGNRSAVVVVISDGAAGGDNSDYNNSTNATNCANDAIGNGGLNLKKNGAYIFTVQIGSQDYVSGFEETDFMKYLSSKYTGSTSMTNPGPLNTKENNYYINVPVGSSFNIDTLTNSIFNEVVANSQNAIASLTGGSILREQLTDVFDLTNATISYQTAQSKYDGIGRLYFEEPVSASGFTTTFDKTSNEIIVKGFDYSANNVSEYNSDKGLGKKLIVTIKGVVADRDKILTNASINDEIKTGIYQNSTYMSKNQAVKKFPTYHFSIPEYTYVMDYDLPMLDTDINGTLVSVDTAPVKQDVDNYTTNLQTDVFGVKFAPDENGLVNQNMYYSLNSQDGSAEDNSRAYVLIKRDNGDYDWFRLNLLPASTVYYEDNKTKTVAGTESYADWVENNYTNYATKYQTPSGENDIFGNDPAYSGSSDTFSLGTNLKATVSSTAQRSETKTFSFKGTGFDLISACGNNTGIQTVVVKDSSGAIKKVYVVDTFYNDSTYGTIYQAPIVHFEGAYDEYVVETTAAYYSFAGALQPQTVSTNALGETGIDAYTATAETSVTDEFFAEIGMDELIGQEVELVWMDENSVLNGGEGATETIVSTQSGTTTTTPAPATSLINYIDGFRIYNPLEKKYSDAYYPANEKNATYFNLMSCLETGAMQGQSLFAYIEGNAGSFTFGEYTGLKGKGPKNEVYLTAGNNGVSFKLSVSDYDSVSAKLGMRKISGTPKVVINGIEYTVSNTSEQYYDITEAIKKASSDGIVTIKVTGSGLVALSNLRLNNATLVSLVDTDLTNVARMMTMAATPVTYDPSKVYTPAPTFVDAPADNPAIDPEGRIPTLEEYIAIHGSGNSDNNDHSGADSFADKLVAIVEKLIDFIKKVIALVVKTVTSLV